MEWMVLPYKRYADFSGRSRRKEYWMFFLFVFVVYLILAAIMLGGMPFAAMEMAAESGVEPTPPGPLFWLGAIGLAIFALVTFIPALAVQVRRFHDQDKSGWFVLLNFIPYIGGLVVLVFMCIDGTRGANRFGPDPKDPASANVFA